MYKPRSSSLATKSVLSGVLLVILAACGGGEPTAPAMTTAPHPEPDISGHVGKALDTAVDCAFTSTSTGLAGVGVSLLDSNATVQDTAQTDGGGYYEFYDLSANDTYSIAVDESTLPQGVSEECDYDGITTPHEAAVSWTSGDTLSDINFGYQ